jgi:putative tricarboxylic transport membrane protein
MSKAVRWSGVFWTLFAIFIGYHSYKLGLGTLHMPGPGFLFFWTAIFIGVLSLVDLWRSQRVGVEESPREAGERTNVAKVLLVLLALFLYVMLIERLGFILVTMLFFLFLLGVIEKKKWSLTFLVSVVVTVAAYLVFETALQSQLPKGLLEYFRGF